MEKKGKESGWGKRRQKRGGKGKETKGRISGNKGKGGGKRKG